MGFPPKTVFSIFSFTVPNLAFTMIVGFGFLPPAAMSSNRHSLVLDEQAFQALLAAAFTIQEHGDRLKQMLPSAVKGAARSESEADSFCQHCGSLKFPEEVRCRNCGRDEFRPGERLQRNWASLWLMSQERGLWPERPAGDEPVPQKIGEASRNARYSTDHSSPAASWDEPMEGNQTAVSSVSGQNGADDADAADTELVSSVQKPSPWHAESAFEEPTPEAFAEEDEWSADSPGVSHLAGDSSSPESSNLDPSALMLSAGNGHSFHGRSENVVSSDDSAFIDGTAVEEITPVQTSADGTSVDPISPPQRFADFRLILRFHRADFYLGLAVVVAAVALLWPSAGAPQPNALGPVDRALIALGVAEAPVPAAVHYKGDPGINVWADPHTALYYCPGEELYGKTADGHVSTQHDAQMDRFQPAGRSPCD